MGIGKAGGGPPAPPNEFLSGIMTSWIKADSNVYTAGSRDVVAANKIYFTAASSLPEHNLGTGDFFLSISIYKASVGIQRSIMSKRQDANNFWYLENTAGNLVQFVATVGGVNKITIVSTTALVAATWYNIQVIVDRSNAANTKIYINGVDDTNAGSTVVSVDNIDNTGIFRLAEHNGTYWNGRLSKFGIGKVADITTISATTIPFFHNRLNGRLYGEMTALQKTDWGISTYYNLNEGDGTDAAFNPHTGNHLTVVGDNLITNGDFETVTQTYGARQFNSASSRYFAGTDNATLEIGDNDAWWAGWVYLDSKTAIQRFISKDNGATQREYNVGYLNTSDRFVFTVSNDGSAVITASAATLGSPSVFTWYFIMAYHDAVNNTINISVNGGAFDSVAFSGGIFTGTATFYIGSLAGASQYVDGRLTRLAIGKSPPAGIAALATTIRDALYASGKGVNYAGLSTAQKTDWGLVECWDSDETTSSNLNGDHAGIHLTNTNSVGVANDMHPQADFGTYAESGNSLVCDETVQHETGSHGCKWVMNPLGSPAVLTVTSLCQVGHRYLHSVRCKVDAITNTPQFQLIGGGTIVTSTPTTSYQTYSSIITQSVNGNTLLRSNGAAVASSADRIYYFDSYSVKAVDIMPAPGPQESIASDSIGTNHGVLTNMDTTMAWSTDVPAVFNGVGYSLQFDGVNDFVSIPDFAHSLMTLSCFCWIKTTATNNKNIFAHYDSSSQISWDIRVGAVSTDKLNILLSDNGVNIRKNYEGSINISDGQWHHVGFTYNVDTLKLYVDGVEDTIVNKVTDTAITSIHNSTAAITIGARLTAAAWSAGIAATIKDCRIYNEEVSAANVANIKNGLTYITNLAGHWKFDDGPQSATISNNDPICCIETKDGNRRQFMQGTADKRPLWIANSPINNKPAMLFDGLNDLLVHVGAFLTGTQGAVIIVYRLTAIPNTSQVGLSSGDEASSVRYNIFYTRGNTANNHIQYQRYNNDTFVSLDADTVVNVDTNYKMLFQSDGSLITAKLNNAVQVLNPDSGTNNGAWFDSVSAKDNVTIGAYKLNVEASFLAGYICEIITTNAVLNPAQEAKLNAYTLSEYGL